MIYSYFRTVKRDLKLKKHFYESLKKYKRMGRTSFHTPGHKGKFFKSRDLLSLDFTELPLTDSLYEASGIITEIEKNIKELYNSKRSIVSCGGNTLSIQTMFRLASKSGGNVLCDRVVHRSAVSAMALLGINPVWIKSDFGKESHLAEKINMESLKKHLSSNKSFDAFYTTSPSYHGILQDIKKISDFCAHYSVPVLVDNAHGSHLMFTSENLHPITNGASLCADSAHKTLPVLTGGSWLHINDDRFIKSAKNAMALFGSTSPSYPIMASMDICLSWLASYAKREFLNLESRVKSIKSFARNIGIYVPNDDISDPVRIVLGTWKIGYSGYEFREHLYKYKIEPEMCDEKYVVLIATPFNTKEDWKRLKKSISSVKPKNNCDKDLYEECFMSGDLPEIKASLREAVMHEGIYVDISCSKNRIAADIVCPCPPGVPVVMPGEKIGESEYEALKRYGISEIYVLK